MYLKYIIALTILVGVSAESTVDLVLNSTEELIQKTPKVIAAILKEGQILNHEFSEKVISDIVSKIRQFKEALKRCEEDAANPNNSLFILQNLTNLIKVTYETFQDLASININKGIYTIQRSLYKIKQEIDQKMESKPLKIDYLN